MLYRMENMIGMSIVASDGDIGKVSDIYFDDKRWATRYLVVQTGGWFDSTNVLISPFAVNSIDWLSRSLRVDLSKQRVKDSPSLDTDRPVSRQHEIEFSSHYGYPRYWAGPLLWGESLYPVTSGGVIPHVNDARPGSTELPADRHLRSIREIGGYHLQASGDAVGHVADFLVEGESWAIRYIVVDTHNWWPSKHVVIPPQWVTGLDWDNKLLIVDVASETVKNAPEYNPSAEYSRDLEMTLYRHYEKPAYWQ